MPLLVVLCTVWQKIGTNFLLCASFSVLDRCSSNHQLTVVLRYTNVRKPEHLNARGTNIGRYGVIEEKEGGDGWMEGERQVELLEIGGEERVLWGKSSEKSGEVRRH